MTREQLKWLVGFLAASFAFVLFGLILRSFGESAPFEADIFSDMEHLGEITMTLGVVVFMITILVIGYWLWNNRRRY